MDKLVGSHFDSVMYTLQTFATGSGWCRQIGSGGVLYNLLGGKYVTSNMGIIGHLYH